MNKFEDRVLAITRIQSGDKDEVNIRFIDLLSTSKPVDIRLSLEDFSKAVFGDMYINCKVRKG